MSNPDQPGQPNQQPSLPGLPNENDIRRRQEEDLRPSALAEGQPIRPPPGVEWSGPPQIGRADLDPFSTGIGGGMIFDPRDPRHYPVPGQPNSNQGRPFMPSPSGPLSNIIVPPGARFDPYSGVDPPPPDAFRGRGSFFQPRRGGRQPGNPDNDHMRPPGYDDMFM